MAGDEHRFSGRMLEPDASYGVVVPVPLIECHLAHGRQDLARRAYRDLRGFLGGENIDQQVEKRFPVHLADPQVTDVRDDVVLGQRSRTPGECPDSPRGSAGSAARRTPRSSSWPCRPGSSPPGIRARDAPPRRLPRRPARASRRCPRTCTCRWRPGRYRRTAGQTGWLARSRTPRQTSWIQAAAVLDEMLEPGTDSRLQPTPPPNTNVPFTCDFTSSMVASVNKVWIYGGTSEIMKTIIAREVTGLRT